VGADLPLETEKNVAGVSALALLDAVETEFGLKSEIYKKLKQEAELGVVTASYQVQF
jgi:homoserine kinase